MEDSRFDQNKDGVVTEDEAKVSKDALHWKRSSADCYGSKYPLVTELHLDEINHLQSRAVDYCHFWGSSLR